jgi:hypothetical protein
MDILREDLRKWFGRKGAKGKTGGWVDCNAPDGKGGYKPCGRKKGEKRKYPACRPTPAGCKDKGKGKKWGKKSGKSKKMKKEDLMNMVREELRKLNNSSLPTILNEDDACTRKVKARYKVWPSAYASGAVAKCRKVGAANWGKSKKKKKNEEIDESALSKSKKNYAAYGAKNEDKELKNPKKADLDKDGKLSSYEKARGKGIEKAMGISEYDVEDGQDVKEFIEFMRENYLNTLEEAEYKGRKVKLGKPMRGDVKKFKVYVKNPKGNVVKVNFGQKGMNIKKNNPKRRKAFRARHNCDNPGPRHKARYWSCRKW